MHRFKRLQNKNDEIDDSQLSVDSFKFLKYLDKGGFGKVFQVRKKQGENKNEVYAMKIISKKKIVKNSYRISQVVRESTVMKSLRHPFVVQLVYAFQGKANLYMVLKYASRGSLGDILAEQICLNEKEAAFYTKEIILAIGYIHSRNIIHRDIKPRNILIDDSGHVKLCDFGLCSEGSRAYSKCGTRFIMAPEMFHKNGYGQEVDWWALGVIFYRMLIGTYPFNISFKSGPFLPTGEISKEAESLITGLLTIKPKERLGYNLGAWEVRNHSFFKNTCWINVFNCLETPPFMPETKYNCIIESFRRLFPRLPGKSKHLRGSQKMNNGLFKGFSYAGPDEIEVAQSEDQLCRKRFIYTEEDLYG